MRALRARFRGPPPRLEMMPPAAPPPRLRLIPLVDAEQARAIREDAEREERLLTVLRQLGVETQAHCRECGQTQPFAGVSANGLCFAHALAERASRVSDDQCVCWRQDPTLERLTRDTEPLLSSDRDTRDTDPCPPPWLDECDRTCQDAWRQSHIRITPVADGLWVVSQYRDGGPVEGTDCRPCSWERAVLLAGRAQVETGLDVITGEAP